MKILLGVVLGIVGLITFFVLKGKRDRQIAQREKGEIVGQWKVYYDVKEKRIGLVASFGEEHLLRYLIFRLHDLFSYKAGLRGQQEQLAQAMRAAIAGQANWTLLFPPPKEDCFHAHDAPNGTLFKFFDGTLYEGAVTQPRFLGGDAIAKQEGLVGECIALAGYLLERQPEAVKRSVETLVARQLAEGDARGAFFWRRAVASLNA
ncbi:MAG: hypothetical protein AAGE52_11665 [Myxococcota bacterium]